MTRSPTSKDIGIAMPTKRFATNIKMQHAAVLPHGLARLTTLLQQYPNHPISRRTLQLAARNPVAGFEMVELLLLHRPGSSRNLINDPDVYDDAISNETHGVEILDLLLKLGSRANETVMAKAAIQGVNSVEYVAALLKHGGKITDLVMQQAMRNKAKGVQVLELLLEHGANATEASMKFVVGHELMGLEYVRIFIEHGAKINDHILQTAMCNCTHGVGILGLLLKHGASVTEACMKFAAGLELVDDVDRKILEEHGHKRNFEPVASNRRREIILFKFLLEHREDSTKNPLEAAAAKKLPSPEYLKLLIEHGGIPSEPVMIAAADNEKCGPQCCEILLSMAAK